MKQSLLFVFATLINLTTYSQSIFQTAYGSNDIDEIKSVVMANNHYYVVGQSINPANFDKDITFFCIDTEGGLLWSVTLGTNKNDIARGLTKTSDGGFAISGETYGGFIDSTTSDLFFIKTDDQGFPLFAETYGGSGNEIGGGILEDLNGNFYISGTTSSFGNALESAMIIKIDASGNQIWTNVNSSMDLNRLNGIKQKSNGEIYASGSCYPNSNLQYNNYVVRIDTNGNLVQAKRSSNSNQCILADLILTNDGGYVTCGKEFLNLGNYNMNVCKYDSSGLRVWNNTYGTNQDEAFSICEADNGDFIVSGRTNVGTVSSPNYKSTILRLNTAGIIIWAKTYGYSSTTSLSNSIISGIDNTIISAGIIHEPGIGSNAHIIKTDDAGNSGCFENNYLPASANVFVNDSVGADWQLVSMTQFSFNPTWQSLSNQFTLYCFSNSVNDIIENSYTVFPNPNKGIFRIDVKIIGDHHLEIFNSLGQKVMQKMFGQEFVELDMTNYSSGIYFYKIDNSQIGKIILTGR